MSPALLSVSAQSEMETWEDLQTSVPFPVYAEASDELAKATSDYNAAVAVTRQRVATVFAKLQATVAASASDSPPPVGELVSQIEAIRIDRGMALQELSEHWQRRERLAERAVAEFSKRVTPAEKNLVAAREKADKDLESIGCSVAALLEVQPTLNLNQEAFDRIRDMFVARVVQAKNAAHDASNLVSAATSQIGVSRRGKEETQKFVQKMVARLAAA